MLCDGLNSSQFIRHCKEHVGELAGYEDTTKQNRNLFKFYSRSDSEKVDPKDKYICDGVGIYYHAEDWNGPS